MTARLVPGNESLGKQNIQSSVDRPGTGSHKGGVRLKSPDLGDLGDCRYPELGPTAQNTVDTANLEQ
jgi:hypothetical protein